MAVPFTRANETLRPMSTTVHDFDYDTLRKSFASPTSYLNSLSGKLLAYSILCLERKLITRVRVAK